MGKLDLIKARLASLLEEVDVKMSTVKTDKAVLEYDGELAEGTAVYVTDAETEERVEAADGEYITEDNKVITVEGGKVVSIVEKAEEPVEEPVVEEPVVAEEVTEEPAEEPAQEEEPAEEPKDEVAELKAEIEGLKGEIEGLKESIKEILDKMATISTAAPVAEEFEKTKTSKKTGNAKVDKFIERYGE